MKKITVFSAVSVLLLCSVCASAQTVPFVNLGYNAEQMAMGATNATYNGASAFMDKSTVDISYFNWQPKASNSSMIGLNAAVKAGSRIAVLVDGKYNALPEMDGYDSFGNPSGTITSSQMYAAFGAAYAVKDNISAFLKFKFVSDKITDDTKAGAVCADLGVNYHKDGLDAALAASNIGSKLDYGTSTYSLPMMVKAGAVKTLPTGEKSTVKLSADAGYILSAKSLSAGVGAELDLLDMIDFRAGYHLGTQAEPSFASVGLGLDVSILRVSAAYLIGPAEAGNTVAATLGLAF
ncbi:MAG: PorV/PorQ family protein [Bacteroidia bacterium]|nr:PorV/PorQ family protein [Bacteroidia bacterium]